MEAFPRYIGIDYSGAATADGSLKNLRVYLASQDEAPAEAEPPASRRKYWTLRGGHWLVSILNEHDPIMVGIDHAFSFPLSYFQTLEPPESSGRFSRDHR